MNKTLSLYPHQNEAEDKIRHEMRNGYKRIMLCAATGFGKTELAADIITKGNDKQSHIAFICDRMNLAWQTSERFWDYGITHGFAQAENTRGRFLPIQVATAQTLESRDYWDEELAVVFLDEAHVQRRKIQEKILVWGGYCIGLSATPITPGLGQFWEVVVNASTVNQLLEMTDPATGRPYLAPLKLYAATEVDMTGAPLQHGEWTAKSARERGRKIIGDVIGTYIKQTNEHFGGPVPTLVFSADIQHGEDLVAAFQAAGLDARQTTYRDDAKQTKALIDDFGNRKYPILVSVEKCVKGFDQKIVQCIVGTRAYHKSLAALLQQMGRGMRPDEGKDFCIESSQRVLTNRGLVAICDITPYDLLWDGIEWVSHGGAIRKGIKEVISYDGITATPDHLVGTRRGWMALAEARRRRESLLQAGTGGTAIRNRADCLTNDRAPWPLWQTQNTCPHGMPTVQLSGHHHVSESGNWTDKRMPSLQPTTKPLPTVALQTMCGNETAMRQLERCSLPQLWRAGHQVPIQVNQGSNSLDRRQLGSAHRLQNPTTGSGQQRWELRARKHALGQTSREPCEQETQHLRTDDSVQIELSRSPIRRLNSQKDDVHRVYERSHHPTVAHPVLKTEREVWDILNAGPRNRFVCEGVIVHNCLYIDHGGNLAGWYDAIMDFWANGVDHLDDTVSQKTRKEGRERTAPVCPSCGFLIQYVDTSMFICPACGYQHAKKQSYTNVTGYVAPVKKGKATKDMLNSIKVWDKDKGWTWQHLVNLSIKQKKGDTERARKFAYAQYKTMFQEWPERAWGFEPTDDAVDDAVRKRVQYQVIRYQNGRQKFRR